MPRGRKYSGVESRFGERYAVDEASGCWLWLGAVNNNGHGMLRPSGGPMKLAHRVSWELVNGPIEGSAVISRTCGKGLCVNPDHMRLGSRKGIQHKKTRGERLELSPEQPCNGGNKRAIALTKFKVAIVDADEYERLSAYKWYAMFNGWQWYACRHGEMGSAILMHRDVIAAEKGVNVDHINGDGLDNTRANLRIASTSENGCNRKMQSNNVSGFKGVTWDKQHGKWKMAIRKGEHAVQRLFDDPITAAEAYDEAAKQLHGEFAKLNFPVQ